MSSNFNKGRDNSLEFEGRVIKSLPGMKFVVELVTNNHQIDCTVSGRMRRNRISLVRGDLVKVKMTPYDLSKGRIVFRQTNSGPRKPRFRK